jgi:PIN domain
MRTNHILIDWENVQPDSLELLNRDDVRVYLFTGALQKSIPTSTAAALQPLGSRAQYIQMARSGRNALDFHIAFYIGRLSATEDNPYFHVIAKDKDLDVLIEHLKTQKIFCTRSAKVTDMPFIKLSVAKSPRERMAIIAEFLRAPANTLPTTRKRLAGVVKARLDKSISGDDIEAVVQAMIDDGFAVVDGPRVTFPTTIKGKK